MSSEITTGSAMTCSGSNRIQCRLGRFYQVHPTSLNLFHGIGLNIYFRAQTVSLGCERESFLKPLLARTAMLNSVVWRKAVFETVVKWCDRSLGYIVVFSNSSARRDVKGLQLFTCHDTGRTSFRTGSGLFVCNSIQGSAECMLFAK